jgi:multiple sugar transport system ATP-binding protein
VAPEGLAAEGLAVTLGVRPEDVLVAEGGEPALVRVVEPTGHESIVFFELAGHSIVARVGPDVRLRPGEPVRVALNAAKLHFFRTGDGQRLNADAAQRPDAAREAAHKVA